MKKYNIISLGLILSVLPAFTNSSTLLAEDNPAEYTGKYIKKHLGDTADSIKEQIEKWKKEASDVKADMEKQIEVAAADKKDDLRRDLQKKLDEAESQIDQLNKKLEDLSK
jgi:hypothetical protein